MVKKITTLNIDSDLIAEAKRNYINLSQAAAQGIKSKLNIKEEVKTEIDSCEFCGRVEEKATPQNLVGLTWLCPDEKWICSKCLENESFKMPAGR